MGCTIMYFTTIVVTNSTDDVTLYFNVLQHRIAILTIIL